jgi:PHP family Zn ribbon phosphoesterase
MGPRLRKMKSYHPRRRTRGKSIHTQAIHDIKHRLSSDVGTLITMLKDGNNDQITEAQLKVKSDFLKHSEEMQQIAQKMGGKYVKVVREYLDSIDNIVHTGTTWVDDSKIRECYVASEKLDRELEAAA